MKRINVNLKRRLLQRGWHRYVLTVGWSASFTYAAFLFHVIVGFIVLGVVILLLELRADD